MKSYKEQNNLHFLFLLLVYLLSSNISINAQCDGAIDCSLCDVSVNIISGENINIIEGTSIVPGTIGPQKSAEGNPLIVESLACGSVSFEVEVVFYWFFGQKVNWIHGISFKASNGWSSANGVVPNNWIWADAITGDCSNNSYSQGGYYYDGTDETSNCNGVGFITPNDGDASNNWGVGCSDDCPHFGFQLEYCPDESGDAFESISFIFTDDGETGNWEMPANCVFTINIPVEIRSAGIQLPKDTMICSGDEINLNVGAGCDTYAWSTGETTSSIDVSPEETTLYTVTVGEGDCNIVGNIMVEVNEEVNAGKDSYNIVCNGTDDIVNLWNYLSVDADLTGEWFDDNGDVIQSPDNIDLSILFPGVYEFVYKVSNDPCKSDEAIITFEIMDKLNAGDDYFYVVCQGEIVNLFDSLTNYDTGGIWVDSSGDIIADPGSVILDELKEYHFEYEVLGSGFCSGDSAEVTINTIEKPNAGVGLNFEFCERTTEKINLFDYIFGYNSSQGDWYDQDKNKILFPKQYDISIFNVDTFTFNYIIEDVSNVCGSDTAEVKMIIVPKPNAGNDNQIDVCNSDLNNTINIESLLGVHDKNGQWVDLDGLGLSLEDVSHLEFSGKMPGVYRFEYILGKDEYCPADSALITVYVLEKHFAGDDKELVFCEGATTNVSLLNELIPDITNNLIYKDFDDSESLNYNTGVVDVSGMNIGNYRFGLITGSGEFCGMDTSILTIEIVGQLQAGSDNSIEVCNTNHSVNLDSLLGEHNISGQWINLDNCNVDIITSKAKRVDFTNVKQGIYRFEYLLKESGYCPESSAIITVTVNSVSYFDIVEEICSDESIIVNNSIYDKTNLTGVEVLVNRFDCDSIVTIDLTIKNISAVIDVNDANCFGGGKLIIEDINEGVLPANIILNNNDSFQITRLPFEIKDLLEGEYSYMIIDADGCKAIGDSIFTVSPFTPYDIDITATKQDDSYVLSVTTDMVVDEIVWYPEKDLSCLDCLNPVVTNSEDGYYSVLLKDKEGCELRDTIYLKGIEKKQDEIYIYIPNVFSPDNDGFNDRFYVSSNLINAEYSMSIYDRWGEKVFANDNLQFNDPNSGWDGTYKGELLNPAVFVYVIKISKDGYDRDTIQYGDLLLLK